MPELLAWIAQYGFPAVVTVYLLVRLDRTLHELHDALGEVRLALTRVLDQLHRGQARG